MSRRSLPPFNAASSPRMMRPTPGLGSVGLSSLSSTAADLEGSAAPPLRVRQPFAVERMPAPLGFVRLVGYDSAGEYMAEFTLPIRKYTERVPARFEAWLRANDSKAATGLSLVD